MSQPDATTPYNSFFILDADQIGAIASESVGAKGLNYFNENRVVEFEWDAAGVWAEVEGSVPDQPYSVELREGVDGNLEAECNCPYEQESVCKHIVAVLYRCAAQSPETANGLHNAAESAIQERRKKGRSEVRVKHISGDPRFGLWQASSIVSTTHWKQVYQVHIRSLDGKKNYCTCPDWSTNQLGTCKHIEAVLHQIGKQGVGDNRQSRPSPFVYLSWESATASNIRLHRGLNATPENLHAVLDQFFHQSGEFKFKPDELFRFCDLIYGREEIDVGEDALNYARRYTEDATQRLRGQEITASIKQSNGQLPGVHARLYPYQVDGVAFLASRGRALLADDMGLGKTLQAICAASWLVQHSGVQRILVVCPASLKHQWAREIEKFTQHDVKIIQGGAKTRHVQYRTGATFIVVNYELVLRDLSVINETLKPDLIILDEAQRIKNWQTKIASTIKLIPSRYAFVLTGTPLENRLEDLYSLLQVVDPKVLGPLWRYLNDFHVTDERDKVIGYRNLSELRKRIAPVMLRRDRKLVSDQLPDRTEVRLDLPLSQKQIPLHDSAMSAAGQLADIAKKRPLSPSEQNRLMAALQQARMACDAAGLVDGQTEGSPKLDELANLLEDLCLQSGHKMVIFSQWERMTKMVETLVRQMGIGFVRLHGGVPTAKRGGLMDRFRDDDGVQVFISTDAGGVGLNLQSATVLVNLDMPWNPAVLDQRIARIHRLGQKQKVQVILLLAQDAYEQQVFSLVKNKRNLFDNVVDPEAQEDVVGVSKRMLETIIENLADVSPVGGEAREDLKPSEQADGEPMTIAKASESSAPPEEDVEVRQTIEHIQSAFGLRVERILGSQGGLLVVMENIDDSAEDTAKTLSKAVPVALIEPRTLAGLNRLGSASPISQSNVLFETPKSQTSASRFNALAQEKLEAAGILIEKNCGNAAIELLSSAMLAAVSSKAHLSDILTVEKAGVWTYAEAIPQSILTPDQGAALLRAIALATASDVPESLIDTVREDVQNLLS